MLGYAVTGKVRSSNAPMSGRCYHDGMDFWNYLVTIPAEPRVLVLQDVDHARDLEHSQAKSTRALDWP
jgi:hypothetical protein